MDQRFWNIFNIALVLMFSGGCAPENILGKYAASVADRLPADADGKVFLKNPVYASRKDLGYVVTFQKGSAVASPAKEINFDYLLIPVRIADTQGGFLQNDHFSIIPSEVERARPSSEGKWLFSSVNDPNFRLGQIMAFYWLNFQMKKANKTLPRSWAAAGKKIRVDSNCGSQGNETYNAFWSPDENEVCMGRVGPFQTSFDASIYNHEMGHANIQFATQGQVIRNVSDRVCTSGSQKFACCQSDKGCIGAIDEGQADMHAYITFNSGTLAEFFVNDMNGLEGRNAEVSSTTKILTAQDRFSENESGRDIHSMGGVWGAAWWHLRNTIGSPATDRIFLANQSLLTGPDNFSTALDTILVTNDKLFSDGGISKNYKSDIRRIFGIHGITAESLASLNNLDSVRSVAGLDQSFISLMRKTYEQIVESLAGQVFKFTERLRELFQNE